MSGPELRGVRFAPSPTGSLHLGNLRTAWISWAWARRLGTPWVLRFEDIDTPRVLAGARERQLSELERLGLVAGEVILQSSRLPRHRALFERGVREGRIYPCFCSRKEVQEALAGMASAPHSAVPVYNGRCRPAEGDRSSALGDERARSSGAVAWRFRGSAPGGEQDFIIGRAWPGGGEDGACDFATFAPAYNWACAIDDRDGGYAVLVRAWDLESVIDQQRAVHRLIDEWEGARPLPAIFHCALVVDDEGHRLEKRTRGVTLPELEAAGWTSERLIERFVSSIRLDEFGPELLRPGARGGESRRQLKLTELGVASPR